jgi:hypothetical protein
MNSANSAIDFDKMLLESAHELNRALALLAATSLMSRHLHPADRTTNALDDLLSGSGLIAEDAASKLDSLGHARKDGPGESGNAPMTPIAPIQAQPSRFFTV